MKDYTVKLKAPSKWDELSNKQLFFVMKNYLKVIEHDLFLTRCLMRFTGIKLLKGNVRTDGVEYFRFQKRSKLFLLTADEFTEMTKSLSYLLKDSTLTVNPLPITRIWFKKYYGPATRLFNITLREFIFAEINFVSYCKSKDHKYLDNLIAILWRPQVEPYKPGHPDFNGDRRERFNDHIFPKRASRMRWMRAYKKFAVFNFYAGSRAAMMKEFPKVFTGGSGNQTAPKDMARQMMNLVRAVNGGDPTKNENILDLNVRDILGEMEYAHEQVQEMKKRFSKRKY